LISFLNHKPTGDEKEQCVGWKIMFTLRSIMVRIIIKGASAKRLVPIPDDRAEIRTGIFLTPIMFHNI